jgi:hypothetical protein
MSRYDLRASKVLPRLDTGGKAVSCLHYDPVAKRLGGISTQPGDASVDMELVSIDPGSGEVTTRLRITDFPMACTRLQIFQIDPSAAPGDHWAPVSRPACTFDPATGRLAWLLVDQDPAQHPAFANRNMFAAVMETREPAPPSSAIHIGFPFEDPDFDPAGNRTWRALTPSMAFV